MNKTLLLLLIVCASLSACNKHHTPDQAPETAGTKYAITLNVSGFTQQILGASNKQQLLAAKTLAASTGISNYVTNLYYLVYDTNNKLVNKIWQQSSTVSNFGTINDNLPAGTYTVVLFAGQDGLTAAPDYMDANSPTTGTPEAYYATAVTGTPAQWKDTFYKKFSLTVSSSPVSQAVTLDRFVGKLEINLEDAIPTNASTVTVSVNQEFALYNYITLTLNTPYTLQAVTTIPDAAKGTTNYKVDNIIANTTTPFTVTIVAKDAGGNLLAQTSATNVVCQQNKTTILTGKLFGYNSGFQVTVNPNWDTGTTIHY